MKIFLKFLYKNTTYNLVKKSSLTTFSLVENLMTFYFFLAVSIFLIRSPIKNIAIPPLI